MEQLWLCVSPGALGHYLLNAESCAVGQYVPSSSLSLCLAPAIDNRGITAGRKSQPGREGSEGRTAGRPM